MQNSKDKNKDETQKIVLATKFVDTLANEAKLKAKELDIKEKGMQGNLVLAEKSINAQRDDNKEEREHQTKREYTRIKYGFFAFAAGLIFCLIAIYLNQSVVVMELIKTIGTLGIGIFGGYFYGKEKGKNQNPKKQNEE